MQQVLLLSPVFRSSSSSRPLPALLVFQTASWQVLMPSTDAYPNWRCFLGPVHAHAFITGQSKEAYMQIDLHIHSAAQNLLRMAFCLVCLFPRL